MRSSVALTDDELDDLRHSSRQKWPSLWMPEASKSRCRECGEWVYWMVHQWSKKHVPVDLDAVNHLERH